MDEQANFIPHLTTAQTGSFYKLEKHILDHRIMIESWFRQIWQKNSPLLTSSVDLRNAGFKIAAVDTNVFPAGFNNLNPDFYPLCIQATQSTIDEKYPNCSTILLIPESHTRNQHYYQSVSTLTEIVQRAGFEVKVGSLLLTHSPQEVRLSSSQTMTLYPLRRENNKILLDHFTPDLILINNDFSEGIPDILKDLTQPIEPSLQLGWSFRSKTKHFIHYNKICLDFANLIGIDAWQICPLFLDCGEIDFVQSEGLDCLVKKSEMLLLQIQAKYNEYGIGHKPFVFIKADAGTYGLAVMSIQDPEELTKLNRKQRTSMAKRKGGQHVNRVIIQEGVYTFETVGDEHLVAEPVVYMLGKHVVGGFYRVHGSRSINENLNSPGMHFEKLAFAECCNNPDDRLNDHPIQNQFYVYSVIARLAMLATCQERDDL